MGESSESVLTLWRATLVASVLESAEGGIPAGLLLELQQDIGLTPLRFGYLALCQSLSAKFSVLFWGPQIDRVAGDFQKSKRFLQFSICGIGCASMIAASAPGFMALALSRIVAGGSGALIRPLSGSLISQLAPTRTGLNFSQLAISGALGKMLGNHLAASYSSTWRNLLFSFGSCCFAIAFALEWAEGKERDIKVSVSPGLVGHDLKWSRAKAVMSKTSFKLIVLHGVFGSFPYTGFSLLLAWFQSGGVPAGQVAWFGNSFYAGTVFGLLFAGPFGDFVASKLPNHGRIFVAQVADVIRIPLTFVVFSAFGVSQLHFAALCLFSLGLVTPFVGTGAVKPMIIELCDKETAGTISGIHLALESIFGVLAGPIIGALAQEAFGYDTAVARETSSGCRDSCFNLENHVALGKALLWNTLFPWSFCAFFVIFLHCTFPADRRQ